MDLSQVFAEMGLKTDLSLIILTVALLCARVLPVIILSPFLGGEVLPPEIKIGLGLMLAGVIFPSIAGQMVHIPTHPLPYVALLLKELFIGLCISFIVDMVFQAAQVAGNLVDSVSGASNAQLMAPQLGIQVSLFANLKFQLAVVTFLTLNGHHLVIRALADSFVSIPLDRFPEFHQGAWPFFELLIRVSAELMRVALSLAAPAFIASFLTDLALGMINRVAPQVQVYFVSMQVKPVVVTIMVLVSIHLVISRLEVEFRHMHEMLDQALKLLA